MRCRFARPAARCAATVAMLLICACGGPTTTPRPPVDERPDATGRVDAGSTVAAPDVGDAPLTAAECDRFVDHMVGLAAGMRAGDAAATPEEIEAARTRLRAEMREACLQVGRPMYECAMRARDQAGLGACQQASR